MGVGCEVVDLEGEGADVELEVGGVPFCEAADVWSWC